MPFIAQLGGFGRSCVLRAEGATADRFGDLARKPVVEPKPFGLTDERPTVLCSDLCDWRCCGTAVNLGATSGAARSTAGSTSTT